MDKLTLTYALLGHYKECSKKQNSSIFDIFVPIMHKTLLDYMNDCQKSDLKGCALSEIQKKLHDSFALNFPIPVLRKCLLVLQEEINNPTLFNVYNDNSFILQKVALQDFEPLLKETENELAILEDDFASYCQVYDTPCEFSLLLEFIQSMQIEMFTNSNIALQDINNVVPKYIQHSRTNNAEIYTIICNIYLGGLISSYLEHDINAPITKAELLIDTNYFISLINLNTEDAYNVCMDLHTYCTQFGFRMSVLPSTVEQIKILLSNRIDSFAQKDYIGTVKVADIFSACKRRNIDKTQLELIRDQVDKTLENFQITILKEAQIAKYVDRAKKSTTYTILKTKRHNDDSALNDAIALEYVQEKRGKNIREFKDVQCWFLHNSYSTVYADPGMKIENKTSISASELLSLLWLASPSQLQSVQLAQVGLSTYVTKYLEFHVPADTKLKNIKKRADYAIEMGKITDEDFYHLCTRMSEGELSVDEIDSLENIPDEEFSIYMAKIIAAKNQITKDAQDAINRDREHQKLLIYKKQLQHQRDDLEKEIREISQELDPLETQRKNSFCDWQPKLCWAIAGLLILAMIVLGCLLFPTCAILEDQTKHYIQIVMPIVFCVIGIIASIALFLMGNERTTKRQDYAYQKWEQKTKNQRYNMLHQWLLDKQETLKEIKTKLENL